VHFDLVNPVNNSGHPRAPAAEGAVECGAWDAPITRQAMDLSDATLLAVAGSAAPLFVHQPEVTLAEVAAHAPFPGVPNQVAFRRPRRAPAALRFAFCVLQAPPAAPRGVFVRERRPPPLTRWS
jgi:hypothetical protein